MQVVLLAACIIFYVHLASCNYFTIMSMRYISRALFFGMRYIRYVCEEKLLDVHHAIISLLGACIISRALFIDMHNEGALHAHKIPT